MNLDGRHALVCGASRGIGRAAAFALAELGAGLTLLARSEARLEALRDPLLERGAPRVHLLAADLDLRAQAVDAVARHLEDAGPVHILINNTGGPAAGPLLDVGEPEIVAALGRHLLVAHALVRAVLPGMIEAGFGRIVNVLSTSVREPIDNLGVSNLTRAAVASWAKTLSRELPPGVTINNVLPGLTDTERLTELAAATALRRGMSVDQVHEEWLATVPEGRLGRPEELGAVIALLCSPVASFVRGVSLPVDGGRLRSL